MVIFAGGKSSRMGEDKSLMPFGGYATMAEYQYRRFEHLFSKVYISTKSDKFGFDVDILYDAYEASSPMVGLASVLQRVEDDEVFILSVDMPLVDEDIIQQMTDRYDTLNHTPDILIARSPQGTEPLCGIYSKRVLTLAQSLVENDIHTMHRLYEELTVEVMSFENSDKFANLNTIDEYINCYKKEPICTS